MLINAAALKKIAETASRLASMDPQDEAVQRTIEGLQKNADMLHEQIREEPKGSWGENSMKNDAEFISEQIKCLKAAAVNPARNYMKIVSIIEGLERAAVACQRPENTAMLPRIAEVTRRVAGIFKKVDTVEDLERPLTEIEAAVAKLYGPDQSRNDSYFFDRKGKGHHNEK
jgi:seryl-tRNA synthetase